MIEHGKKEIFITVTNKVANEKYSSIFSNKQLMQN